MEGGCTAALGEFHTTAVFPSSGEMNQYPSTVEPQQNRMVLRGKHATGATIPLPDRSLAQAGCRCAARARRSQDTSPTHTYTSGCSGQLLQLRKQGKAVPLPSWSQVPLHSSALPRANTSVGAHMLVPSPTAGHGEQGRLGSLEKESLLPRVSPVPLLLGSDICTGESFKARRGTEQGKTMRMLFPSTEAVCPHAPAATPTQS